MGRLVPIPTMYRGRQYRSRLEARWACFFDLIKWSVEYEPCDFNGWIPDFVINGHDTVYVEVKPVSQFPQDVADKLARSGCPTEMLIVGQGINKDHHSNVLYLGWLYEYSSSWVQAPFGIWKSNNPQKLTGFCSETGTFRDRITGSNDGGSYGSGDDPYLRVTQAWTEAGNTVQWKAPK